MNAAKRAYYQGFATALAIVKKYYGEESLAENVMQDAGLNLKDFREAQVDEYDLKILEGER